MEEAPDMGFKVKLLASGRLVCVESSGTFGLKAAA